MLKTAEPPHYSAIPWGPQACWHNQVLRDLRKLISDKDNLVSGREDSTAQAPQQKRPAKCKFP